MNFLNFWGQFSHYMGPLDIWQILSSSIFLLAIIDPFGNMPIAIDMQNKGVKIHPNRVCIYSALILFAFLILGDIALRIFGIQIEYFAIAGGFVILLMALEMLLDIVIFKMSDLNQSGDLIPLAFPMYAGPGAFTALLSLTTDYTVGNLLISICICMLALYVVLKATGWLTRHLGIVSLYILRKFFGVIVLAIAVQLMFGNLIKVLHPEDGKRTAPMITNEASQHGNSVENSASQSTTVWP